MSAMTHRRLLTSIGAASALVLGCTAQSPGANEPAPKGRCDRGGPAVGLGAKAPVQNAVPANGDPSDMRTPLGPGDGYSVERCGPEHAHTFVVRGAGSAWALDIAPGTRKQERTMAAFAFLRQCVAPAIGDITKDAVVSSGVGIRCSGEIAADVRIDDWKRLDSTIAAIGRLLKEGRFAETVVIQVGGPPILI
jgi:hypothetical protein